MIHLLHPSLLDPPINLTNDYRYGKSTTVQSVSAANRSGCRVLSGCQRHNPIKNVTVNIPGRNNQNVIKSLEEDKHAEELREVTTGRSQSRRRKDRPHLMRTGSPSAVLPLGNRCRVTRLTSSSQNPAMNCSFVVEHTRAGTRTRPLRSSRRHSQTSPFNKS